MFSSSSTKRKRSRAKSEPSRTQNMDSTRRKQGRCQSSESLPGALKDSILSTDPYPRLKEEMVITSMRAVDVALGLRRLPAGFYIAVRHSGHEWRTETKSSSVNPDLVEWTSSVPLPSNLSTTVHFGVYASFERQPMLGAGEQLGALTVTMKELLDHSAGNTPFTFLPEDGDVVSPCSSISVTIERQMGSAMSRALLSCRSFPGYLGELEDITHQGHSALSRYRKRGEREDLELSIAEFERAHNICPRDHPCRAAAQSNLAMAIFVRCQVDGAAAPLETLLAMYQEVLRARPIGHVDRPSTLIQLAAVSFARYDKSKDEVEGARCEALLHEVLELSSEKSHENRCARVMLQLRGARGVDSLLSRPSGSDEPPSVNPNSRSGLADQDLWISSVALLGRYQRLGELDDLERGIATTRELVRTTSDDRGLRNLGQALLERSRRLGELHDLNDAIYTLKDAVQLTHHGHPQRPSCLNNLGSSFLTRFLRLGQLGDLDDAIQAQRDAVELTPHGHPDKSGRLTNLGSSLLTRFRHFGEFNDLENATSTLKDAVQLTPDGHPGKSVCLSNLGSSLRTRFERLGELCDLNDAISALRDAVQLTSCSHSDKPGCLSNLGNSLVTRFSSLGELGDLDDAISNHRDAVQLTPDGHPDKPNYLNNLGSSFRTRFLRLGELSDLDDAISTLKDAVLLTPRGHPDKSARLNNLGSSLHIRFERLGQLGDLGDAISSLKDAVHLARRGHPDKPNFLDNLGSSLHTRFERLGELCDLNDAISALRDSVQLTPHGHHDKPGRLSNLGNNLVTRFSRLGELDDLDDAILNHRDAVQRTPHSHPNKPSCLGNLGKSLRTRFLRLGEIGDLDDAISALRDAVQVIPYGHPNKPALLNNLGNSLRARFLHLGELGDLDNAISTHRDAVLFTPCGHPDRPALLNNLGSSLHTRFERLGDSSDLDDVISLHRDTVSLTPHSHPDRPGRLNNLGNSFITRFGRLGELHDLDDGISTLKDAIQLTPHGHPDKPSHLKNLGGSLLIRFRRLGELNDLDDSILILGNAVELTPDGHPDKLGHLSNLGSSLLTRFGRLSELDDLDNAISILSGAAQLTPLGHPDKSGRLTNLGSSLLARFEHLREPGDLDSAISTLRDAVELTPHGHPKKPKWFGNLGISLFMRFVSSGDLDDLESAISIHRNAVQLTPHGHPDKPGHLNNLGNSLRARFERLGELHDMEGALSVYSYAAIAPGPIRTRFHASKHWISCARRVHHSSLLRAYSVAISLLPQLAWIGLSLAHRYSELTQGADVVREAAAAALDAGLPELAVEWLERGRSIVWGDLLQLRSSYEELASAHQDHARRLQELSISLDHASATYEQSLSASSPGIEDAVDHAPESLRQQADQHRALAIKRDDLLQEIRKIPGFERFLLAKDFSQLRVSAHAGPVVILNAAESRCDALIVLGNVDHVVHVPLPRFTLQRLAHLQNTLKSLVRQEREGHSMKWEGARWETFLPPLWRCIVQPVLDALAFSAPASEDLSRIFWCPTGTFSFLPIHAAGLYGDQYSQPGHKVFDFVVSSYTPSLAILAPSPDGTNVRSDNLRLLAVRQPVTDGKWQLPGVVTELSYIREAIEKLPSACTTLVEPPVGTVEEVLSLMQEADWVHFACHGVQDGIDSGLCLADGRRLKVRDVIALSHPRGGLAFLSACQTATGEKRLSDEAIHIAAGMLFAGYGGVVGTMWSISDSLAPGVARDVYRHLFRNGTRRRPDYREAAYALHEAIGSLRDGVGASFEEWIPFIHVGL